jgi:hypothetical protein
MTITKVQIKEKRRLRVSDKNMVKYNAALAKHFTRRNKKLKNRL